jgi:hypothetical protein
MLSWLKKWLFKKEYDQLNAMIDKAKFLVESPVYTTIRTFRSTEEQRELWAAVKRTLASEEYQYLVFLIREICIQEGKNAADPKEYFNKLGMIEQIHVFLEKEVKDSEGKV